MSEIDLIVYAMARHLTDKGIPSKQWARDLKAREEAGDKLTYTQSRFWREALQADLVAREPGSDDQ